MCLHTRIGLGPGMRVSGGQGVLLFAVLTKGLRGKVAGVGGV